MAATVFDTLDAAVTAAHAELTEVRKAAGPQVADVFDGLRSWADAALLSARSLQRHEDSGSIGLGSRSIPIAPADVALVAASPLIAPFLKVRLAEEGARRARRADERAAELLQLLVSLSLGSWAEDYLRRVAALYLWGFDEETFALARATLDAALRDVLSVRGGDAEVKKRLALRSRWVTLDNRIDVLGPAQIGLLSEPLYELARNIRTDGNDVLHHGANHHLHHSGPLEVIRSLGLVLNAVVVK